MRLSVRIPESDASAAAAALGLARMAPAFQLTRGDGRPRGYLAIFPDLPQSLDLAVRLIGEAVFLPDVLVQIRSRTVVNLSKFWSALLCYRENLLAPDPKAYCARLSARLSSVSGCPDRTCVSHCQFICTRCFQVIRESGAPPVAIQLQEVACQAEADWCPNLRLPAKS